MNDVIKAIEIVVKFAWPTMIFTACILYVPQEHMLGMNFSELRKNHLLELQVGLLISTIMVAGTLLPSRANLWRYVFCPLKKFFFPIMDRRSGIKQSRMRYRKIAVTTRTGEEILYQSFNSNGNGPMTHYDLAGKRIFPAFDNGYTAFDDDWSLTPRWGRIDFEDLFNGDRKSGVWPIVER